MSTYTAGPVSVGGAMIVLGQYDEQDRWNGYLCPRLDPHGVEAILWSLRRAYEAAEDEFYPRHEWHGDVLLLTETTDGDDHYTERMEPDEDGLYALGSHGWVWVPERHVTADECLARRWGVKA